MGNEILGCGPIGAWMFDDGESDRRDFEIMRRLMRDQLLGVPPWTVMDRGHMRLLACEGIWGQEREQICPL